MVGGGGGGGGGGGVDSNCPGNFESTFPTAGIKS